MPLARRTCEDMLVAAELLDAGPRRVLVMLCEAAAKHWTRYQVASKRRRRRMGTAPVPPRVE